MRQHLNLERIVAGRRESTQDLSRGRRSLIEMRAASSKGNWVLSAIKAEIARR